MILYAHKHPYLTIFVSVGLSDEALCNEKYCFCVKNTHKSSQTHTRTHIHTQAHTVFFLLLMNTPFPVSYHVDLGNKKIPSWIMDISAIFFQLNQEIVLSINKHMTWFKIRNKSHSLQYESKAEGDQIKRMQKKNCNEKISYIYRYQRRD